MFVVVFALLLKEATLQHSLLNSFVVSAACRLRSEASSYVVRAHECWQLGTVGARTCSGGTYCARFVLCRNSCRAVYVCATLPARPWRFSTTCRALASALMSYLATPPLPLAHEAGGLSMSRAGAGASGFGLRVFCAHMLFFAFLCGRGLLRTLAMRP